MRLIDFLREAATLLAKEDAKRWAAIAHAFGDNMVFIKVGGDSMTVRIQRQRLQARLGRRGRANGVASLDRATLSALMDGRCSLLDALYSGHLYVKAPLETLLALSTVLNIFLDAVMRCPSLQQLWDEYRAAECIEAARIEDHDMSPTAAVYG